MKRENPHRSKGAKDGAPAFVVSEQGVPSALPVLLGQVHNAGQGLQELFISPFKVIEVHD